MSPAGSLSNPNNPLLAADAGGASGEGPKRAPRRRGTRGGRGRSRAKAAPAAPEADPTPEAAAPAPAPRSRARTARGRRRPAAQTGPAVAPQDTPVEQSALQFDASLMESSAPPQHIHPAAEAPQHHVESAPPQPQMESPAPQQPVAENPASAADTPPSGDPSANPTPGFSPGPPRVGMRPAVIRPAPGRMSFSTGKTRHQFRPGGAGGAGGGFRPPRPFTPPVAETPAESGGMVDERAAEVPPSAPATPPAQGMPQNRPQHPHHRGPNPVTPGDNQGNQRNNRQGGQDRGGGGGGGGGRRDQQRNPQQQNRGQRGDNRQRGQQQPQGGNRQPQQQRFDQRPPMQNQPRQPMQLPPRQPAIPQPAAHQSSAFTTQEAYEQSLLPIETQPAETLPMSSDNAQPDVFTPSNLQAPAALSPADASALAPFAEDIEIDEPPVEKQVVRRPPTGRDMLINVVEGEEIRIAVIRKSQLEELYMERSSTESHIGNIYKGRVTNVEPSIQAAFIDFGIGKNGFLHISDLHPQYFPKKMQPRMPQQQQRRFNPAPVPRKTAPLAAAGDAGNLAPGFQPPADPAQPGDAAAQNQFIEPQPLAHQTHAESPAMSLDTEAASESAADQADRSNQTGELASDDNARDANDVDAAEALENTAEAGSGLARAIESVAPETGPDRADSAPVAAGPEDEEATEDAAPVAEEPADFGSAYTAEFSDDDEFMDEYESGNSGMGGSEVDDGHMKPMEKVGRKTPRRERPPIQQCLRRGQEVIVQVTKEGIGTKGPTLTTYVSCPGRYLVMMPGMAQLGVSRKIEDLDQRRELKRTLQDLNPPRNLGFIIRTAGTDVSKKELQGDLNYLVRMWKVIANRIRTHRAPVELYQESDLVIRTIRDVFNEEIDRIIVDNEQVASRVRDFLSIVDPRSAGMVELYTGTMPLFQKTGVEREIEKINSRRVELPNGGSLVIDSTEALVAIDVNSGRYREMRDAELTAFNMNKEALKEVVRQLRLRDLGGVIVIDFIDMREERHKREIEHLLREELVNDRARTKVLRMSQFCMIELTRQRVRPSLKRSIYMDCPHCHGSALIKTPESVSLDVMRRLAAGATRMDVVRLDVKAYPTVATFLLNRKRKALVELEEKTGKRITIIPDDALAGDQIVLQPYDARGSVLGIPM